jgi:hypothetical protein
MVPNQHHDDGDEHLAGDVLVGADKIREFLVSLGVPEKSADPYYLKRSGNGWPIGSTAAGGGRLIASRRRLSRHLDKIARGDTAA